MRGDISSARFSRIANCELRSALAPGSTAIPCCAMAGHSAAPKRGDGHLNRHPPVREKHGANMNAPGICLTQMVAWQPIR